MPHPANATAEKRLTKPFINGAERHSLRRKPPSEAVGATHITLDHLESMTAFVQIRSKLLHRLAEWARTNPGDRTRTTETLIEHGRLSW
jgi:hypothetical protein